MSNHEGEVTIQASVNGRKITLEPIQEIDLRATWREVESTIPCGMRMAFVSGVDDEDQEFVLASGANCGNSYLTFKYKGRQFCVDVCDMATALINFVNEEQ